MLRGFSRKSAYLRYPRTRGLAVLSRSTSVRRFTRTDISTLFNGLFRQSAGVSLLRLPIAVIISTGILTGSAIGFALRLILRTRLTLIRLALIRNPWSFGVEVSRLHYRYLYLHLLFSSLHHMLSHGFFDMRMLPYRLYLMYNPTSSVPDLCPIIIHAQSLD